MYINSNIRNFRKLSLIFILGFSNYIFAGIPKGDIHLFSTPNGTEQCIVHDKMPYANYSKKDLATEQKYCSVDFYSDIIALCPKLDSTSPGTFVYSLEGLSLNQEQAEKSCKTLGDRASKISNYKSTMNQHGTSATNSNGSILAYHFARYFDTNILVPTAVYRTFDRVEHYRRVAKDAGGLGAMIRSAWVWMRLAETKPETYSEKSYLFTPDLKQIVGSMYKMGGERYPSYFNGVREISQYTEFLETPPFVALRSTKPLVEAVLDGIDVAKKNAKFNKELAFEPSPEQMVMWMQDLVEISVLDLIFNQQDRVGNIDYVWAWAYTDGDKVKYKSLEDDFKELSRGKLKSKNLLPPAEISGARPMLIQRTVVKDNDAGAFAKYINRADGSTGKKNQDAEDREKRRYVTKIHHVNTSFYIKLQKLAGDIEVRGPIYEYIKNTFGLADRDFNSIIGNIRIVAAQMHKNCIEKNLNFDLDYEYFFTTGGQVKVDQVSCDIQ